MGVASPYFTRKIEPSVDNLIRETQQHRQGAGAVSETKPLPPPPPGLRP
jgi:hypothetical protein